MKKVVVLLPILLGVVATAIAQTDTTLQAVPLEETVVSASRAPQARSAVAQQVTVLRQAQIAQLNAQSTADLLQTSGAVFVQKSQQGGGSPVLRGFEASRVLLVADGVRMNNAIYRAGHLQNAITMDNAALDRVEVLFGPASTQYGSDALGGAVCFFTKNPLLASPGAGLKTTGTAFVRYGSANDEKTGHLDFSLGGQRFGSRTSLTYSDFGDLRMGANNGFGPFFGRRTHYVAQFNGRDSLVRNPNPLVQTQSGYRQYDFLQKFLLQTGEWSHILNLQYSTSSNIPRYDRLTDPAANGGLASAEWYYGPQDRLMAAYTLKTNHLSITASWQDIEESRHNRNFGAPRRTSRVEDVQVYGLLAQYQQAWGNQSIQAGFDAQYNDVTSTAQRVNVNTGEVAPQSTRYPDGGSTVYNAALFATHTWTCGDQWRFSEGLRVGYSSLSSKFVSQEFYKFPFTEVNQSAPTWSGSLGAVYRPSADWRVASNLSTGFRMPNVDDLAKVFDTQRGSLVVPNPDLGPEQTLNLDFSVTRTVADRVRWENVVWGTLFRNAIVTDVFQFNGADSVLYDGVLSRVLASQNKREARLWGFSSILEADVYHDLAIYASVNYTRGQITNDEEGNSPLDHIPPTYGRAGFRWHTPRANVEGFVLWNGKKRLEDYNLEGEDNLQYAPATGMPAWVTLNVRGGVRVWQGLQVQAGIDNILDTQYRNFASGINAPGRNVWATLRLNF